MYHCRRQLRVNCLRAFSAEFVTFPRSHPFTLCTNKREYQIERNAFGKKQKEVKFLFSNTQCKGWDTNEQSRQINLVITNSVLFSNILEWPRKPFRSILNSKNAKLIQRIYKNPRQSNKYKSNKYIINNEPCFIKKKSFNINR